MFCKGHDIRLSGPALGRRKAGENEQKQRRQMYRDACEWNAVGGRKRNTKHRHGLELIDAKLDETAKAETALILTAMNDVYKLFRWLLHFFKEAFVEREFS